MTAISTVFCERLRAAALPIWQAQLAHPFVRALGDGSLSREVFRFYITQDARFLDELTKTFAFAVTKTADPAEMRRFGELLQNTLAVEQALHERYGAAFGLSPLAMRCLPMSPTNYAYTRHLLHIAATDSLAALITSILPCAWIYSEVGKHFEQTLGGLPGPEHPYADWVAAYAAPEFEQAGAWLRERLDHHAATLPTDEQARLESIFLISSRYEYLFWDMAWRQETWSV